MGTINDINRFCSEANVSEDSLCELFVNVFSNSHSRGFRLAEITDLLMDKSYYFGIDRPKSDWYDTILKYKEDNNIGDGIITINPLLVSSYLRTKES